MFQGLSENHFSLIEPVMEEWVNRNRKGRKMHPWRPVINSIFWILSTGAPWWSLPKGKDFAPRSTSHGWLGRMEKEGFLEKLLGNLMELAELIGGISPERLSIDGFFFRRKRRRRAG